MHWHFAEKGLSDLYDTCCKCCGLEGENECAERMSENPVKTFTTRKRISIELSIDRLAALRRDSNHRDVARADWVSEYIYLTQKCLGKQTDVDQVSTYLEMSLMGMC